MLETCLVLIPILIVAGLIFEVMQMNQIKSIARLALYEAGRHASVTHAEPALFEKMFKQHMIAQFVPKGSFASAEDRQHASIKQQKQKTGLPIWKLTVVSPTKESFNDFADPKLSKTNKRPTIRHDYMDVQHNLRIKQGWTEGKGPQSRQTIFQANTVKIKLTYFHSPSLPGLKTALQLIGKIRSDDIGHAWRQGLFVIVMEHQVMMQSDLKNWW